MRISHDAADKRAAAEYLSGYSAALRLSALDAEAACLGARGEYGRDLGDIGAGSEAWRTAQTVTPGDVLKGIGPGDVRDAAKAAAGHCWSMLTSGRGELEMREHCRAMGIDGPAQEGGPAVARMCCVSWWARRLRAASRRAREYERLPRVRNHCSYEARREYVAGRAAAAAWAASTSLTRFDNGESMTLAELIAVSVSDPRVRAAEMITRIKGAAQYAEDRGLVGVLVTLTAPGSMHPISGDRWDGSSPRDVQARLSGLWARVRSEIWRSWSWCDRPFGLRVVEPHRDGCPHWHIVLFVPEGRVPALEDVLRRHYLGMGPHRPADERHRVRVDLVDGGADGAVSYVIKYCIKHMGHAGDDRPGRELEAGGGHKRDAIRAWAGVWGIRTWQVVGGPPVTVWRAARRAEGIDGALPDGVAQIVAAADSGDWAGYIEAQGGVYREQEWRLVRGRRVAVSKPWPCVASMSQMRRESAGGAWYSADRSRYGDEPAKVVVGILALSGNSVAHAYVRRFRWVAAGRGFVPTRSCVNNCTEIVDVGSVGSRNAGFSSGGGSSSGAYRSSVAWRGDKRAVAGADARAERAGASSAADRYCAIGRDRGAVQRSGG